jgi:type I restriction enzyme, S subunit
LLADKSDVDELQAETKRLEELAQTIFKEWFVNFNFPGATGEMEREVQDE